MTIKTLIIIPARSGSKGIADKNIKKLGSLPLLCWTAQAIQYAKLEQALVILSTDSNEYAAIGKQCGSELRLPYF